MRTLCCILLLGISHLAFAETVTQCDVLKNRLPANAQIVDVRSFVEFKLGHVPGAIHIPHKNIVERAGELNKDAPLVLYCHSGYRAGVAEQALLEKGFKSMYFLEGHWSGWDTDLTASDCN